MRRNLREDAGTSQLELYVSALYGTVVLTGFVHDNLDSELAVAVASDTPGVEEVIDRTVLGSAPDVPSSNGPCTGEPRWRTSSRPTRHGEQRSSPIDSSLARNATNCRSDYSI